MANSSPAPHVVIFPYMAQGHTLPLLDISKALAARGLKITIITTPKNAPFILSKTSTNPSISISTLPFPRTDELPEGCENTASVPSPDLMLTFFETTRMLKGPFEATLKDMSEAGSLPICVISDFFLSWTLDSCRLFGIPRIVSHGMGVLPLAILRAASLHGPHIDPISFPDLTIPFPLHRSDFIESVLRGDEDDPVARVIRECEEADAKSWGIVVNSFEEVDGDYVPALESYLCGEAKAWCIGPVGLYNETKRANDAAYTNWLDMMVECNGSEVVIYVAFGTQAFLSDDEMEEIAFGLEMAGQPFIWVVRSKAWMPPDGWEERVKERGLVIRDWVEQRDILAHAATGGFLSHCGWNSVLESLSEGVPLLAWPMGAEQPLNAKVVAKRLGAGMMMVEQGTDDVNKGGTVGRQMICERVKALMKGEEGVKARERARVLGQMAKKAVEKGGSSDRKLDELIQSLTYTQKGSNHTIVSKMNTKDRFLKTSSLTNIK